MAIYELNPFTRKFQRVDNDSYVIPSLTGDTNVSLEQETIPVDASGGDVDITLPEIKPSIIGKVYVIKKIDTTTNKVTILPSGTDTIHGNGQLYLLFPKCVWKLTAGHDGQWWVTGSWINYGYMTGEPTGFPNRTDTTMSFDDGTLTFSIDPVGTDFTFWSQGIPYVSTGDSIAITDTTGIWFIKYLTDGTLDASQTPWEFQDGSVFVAVVYWDSTHNAGFLMDERHGMKMDCCTHQYLHDTFGSLYESGFTPSLTIGDGSLDTHCEMQYITAGVFHDEDIEHENAQQSSYQMWYRDGADGHWHVSVDGDSLVRITTTRPDFNEWTGATWQRTEVGNNNYVLTHVFATNQYGADTKVLLVMGEAEYTTKALAYDGAQTELAAVYAAFPTPEFIPIGTIIIECKDTLTNSYNARVVTDADGNNFTDYRGTGRISGSGTTPSDHGGLTGLLDDDHTMYYLADGSRLLTGNLHSYFAGTTSTDTLLLEDSNGGCMSHWVLGADYSCIAFDAYMDSGWKSFDAGSNFLIWKTGDYLRFRGASGRTIGNAVPFSSDIMVLSPANKVGIAGEPGHNNAVLQVYVADDGIAVDCPTHVGLSLENSSAIYQQFFSPNSSYKGFFFNENTDADGAQFRYLYTGTASASQFEWRGNASNWMVLQNGNLIVSENGVSYNVAGIEQRVQVHGLEAAQSGISMCRWAANQYPPYLCLGKSRSSTQGTQTIVQDNDQLGIIRFGGADGSTQVPGAAIQAQVDGTPAAGVIPGELQLQTANSSGVLTSAIMIYSDQLVYLPKGQLKFPTSQNSSSDVNTLDDYEEGEFTPNFIGSSGTSGLTYTTRAARYTKIGDTVHIQIFIELSAKGTLSGNIRISGLPFTVDTGNDSYSPVSFGYTRYFTLTADHILQGYINGGTTYIILQEIQFQGDATASLTTSNVADNTTLMISATYRTPS